MHDFEIPFLLALLVVRILSIGKLEHVSGSADYCYL